MKRGKSSIFFVCVIATIISLLSACAQNKRICLDAGSSREKCHIFVPYGLFNADEKNPRIQYSVSGGNIFWGIVLSPSIFVPVIIFGWYVYEPLDEKPHDAIPGAEE